MWRVDWEEEAVQARKQSIAMQAERLLQASPGGGTDVENSLDGVPQGSCPPGGVCSKTYQWALFWAHMCRPSCAVLCCAVLCCAVLCSALLCCAVLC